jgi:hypothetical protein
MRKLTKILAVAAIASAAALPLQSANAWNGPWGSNMFGMDFGQSTGGCRPYYGAPYAYAPVVPQVVPQAQVETK